MADGNYALEADWPFHSFQFNGVDRPRWIKIQIFLGKIGFLGIRKKKFGNSDEKSDFYGSENETRKFRLRTGSPEISRKNGSLPAKTGGLAAIL